MSMIARVRALLVALLLPVLLGSALLQLLAGRDALREQLRQRNQDAAVMLALTISQLPADEPALTALVVTAQFDTGHYREIVLRAPDRTVIVERRAEPAAAAAPAWFTRWLPVDSGPGIAEVSQGWRQVGQLKVSTHAAWAQDALWTATLRSLALALVLGAAAAVAAGLAMRSWARPLVDTVRQARSLEAGRFVFAAESSIPELRQLTRSMNSLVTRLREQFAQQALEVERLRVMAHIDAVTGLPHRRHVLSLLEAALADSGERRSALLLVRVRELAALNSRLGHVRVDELLAALGEGLQTYPRRVEGAFCGRLNGSDFLLYLPRAGVALETAQSLLAALQAGLPRIDPSVDLAVGGVDGLVHASATHALAQADAALARAEAGGPFAAEIQTDTGGDGLPAGEHRWQLKLEQALAGARVSLADHPVRNADGARVMFECPLRVQLDDGGAFEPASRWLPMAARHRMTPRVDLSALDCALHAIAGDGAARCVHVAAASLETPGFVGAVRERLAASPRSSAAVWIQIPEAATAHPDALADAAAHWRACGARVGLGHAGDALHRVPALPTLGLDFVKIDGRHLRGLAEDDRLRDFARGLASLVRPLGLQLLAAGIDDAADLDTLWALGFDAATGPAVV